MPLFDVTKLKNVVQGAADAAASTVRDAADAAATAVEEVKLPEVSLPDVSLPEVKLPDQVQNLVSVAKRGKKPAGVAAQGVTGRAALQIFYFLMSADGEIAEAELVRFNEICAEFGTAYVEQAESIVSDCGARLDAHASSVPLVSAMSCVDEILYTSPTRVAVDAANDQQLFVLPKQLVWSMLVVGYSDEAFDEAEREVVNRVASHFAVDEVLVRELEHAVLTLGDLEREERWVKTTGRPYLQIEAQIAQIAERKAAVLEGAQSLIEL